MAKKDILLKLGIEFTPKDIDAKAIRKAIAKSISSVNIQIAKASFSKEAKTQLKKSFGATSFLVQKARFDSTARKSLQTSFSNISFSISKATFGRSARSSLQQAFKKIPFRVGNLVINAAAVRQVQKQLEGLKISPTPKGGPGTGDAGQLDPKSVQGAAQRLKEVRAAALEAANAARKLKESLRLQDSGKGLRQKRDDIKNLALENLALAKSIDPATRKARQLTGILNQSGFSAQIFGAKIAQVTQRFAAYLISIKAIILLQKAFASSVQSISDFDSALQDISKVIGTGNKLIKASSGLFEVARNTAASVSEVAASFNVFVRAGIGVEEALQRTQAALVATNISELNVTESTRLITAALKIFNSEVSNGIQFLDKLSVVADNAATTQTAVGQAFLRSASSAKEVGVELDDLLGIITATNEQTQLGAGQIGTALKTIFTRLVSNSKALRDQAAEFGINVREGAGLTEILETLSGAFNTLTVSQRTALGLTVAGRRQFNIFAGVLQSFGRAQELSALSAEANGEALSKNAIELNKLNSQVQLVKTNFEELVNVLAGTTEGAEGAGILREAFTDTVSIVNQLITGITTLSKGIGAVVGASTTISGIFSSLVRVGFLAVAGTVIRQIIVGFKTFISIGAGIQNTLAATLGIQNKQLTSEKAVNLAVKERLGLLSQEQGLRTSINAGVNTSVVGGTAGFTPEQRRRNRAAIRDRNIQIRDRTGGQSRLARIGRGARNAATADLTGGRQFGFKGIIALSAAAGALSSVLDDLGETAKKNSDLTTEGFTSAGSAGLKAAVGIGALLGPAAGLKAGLIIAGFSLLKFALDAETAANKELKSAQITEKVNKVSINNLSKFSEGTKKALEEIIDAKGESVNADFAFARILGQATTEVESALSNASDALADTTGDIRRLQNSINLFRDLTDIRQEGRTQQLKFEIGGVEGIEDISGPLAKSVGFAERLTGGLKEAAERINEARAAGETLALTGTEIVIGLSDQNGQLDKYLDTSTVIQRAQKALNRIIDDGGKTIGETLTANRLITPELERQRSGRAKINQRLAEATNQIDASVQRGKEILSDVKEQEKTIQKITAGIIEQKTTEEELISANEILFGFKKQQAEAQKTLNEASLLQATLVERQEKANKAVRDEEQKTLDVIKNLIKSQEGVLNASKARTNEVTKRVAENKRALDVTRENIAVQNELLSLDLQRRDVLAEFATAITQAGSIQERQVASQRSSLKEISLLEADREIRRRQTIASAEQELSALQRQITAQKELGESGRFSREVSEGLKAQAALQQKLFDELSKTAVQKVVAEFEVQVREEAIQKVIELEEELRNVRIEGIRKSLQEQEASSQRFIQSLQSLDGLDAARDLINQQLRGIGNRLRDRFGDIGAIIVRETAKSFEAAAQTIAEELSAVAQISDPAQRRQRAADLEAELTKRREEAIAVIREQALSQIKLASEKVKGSEEDLASARRDVISTNADIITAEKKLSSAQREVTSSTNNLFSAYQQVADATVTYNFALATARFNVLQTTGVTNDLFSNLAELAAASASSVIGSEQKILEIRADIAQKALSIFQSQFESIQSLGTRIATADFGSQADIAQGLGIAGAVAGGADPGQFLAEELAQALQFADLFPGLERAISEFGLAQFGLDADALDSLEEKMLAVAEETALSAKSQIATAQEGVDVANQQLSEAIESKDLSKEQLREANEAKIAAVSVAQSAAGARVTAAGAFARQIDIGNKSLSEATKGTLLGTTANNILNLSKTIQTNSLVVLKDQLAAFNKLATAVQSRPNITTASAAQIAGNASGSLTDGEIKGVLGAARREKGAMPAGSRLMLANTSETVLTRRQSRRFGLRAIPMANAQDGNAGVGDLGNIVSLLNTAVSTLIARLDSPGFIQQNIEVRVNEDRKIRLDGVDQIERALVNTLEGTLGQAATKAEQKAMNDVVISLVQKLGELGIVNAGGF